MPFKSEKQRKWMWANDPEMAKKWEKEEKMKKLIFAMLIINIAIDVPDL